MSSDFDGSVLAIVQRSDGEAVDLLGTGIVVSPNVVLTCAHVFKGWYVRNGETKLPPEVVALPWNTPVQPSRIQISQTLDLCCLHFDVIPNPKPLYLVRSVRLQGEKMTAVGYDSDLTGPRRHVTHEIDVIHDLQEDGSAWLQFGQLRGGLPWGFSGGPVIVKTEAGASTVGILQLGGKNCATSRFMAVDPIAEFLAAQGVRISIGDLPLRHVIKNRNGTLPPERDMKITNSVVIQSSKIKGSVINQPNVAHRAELADETWKTLEFFLAGKMKKGNAKSVAQFQALVSSRQYEAARDAWREMKQPLLGLQVAQSTIEIFDTFFLERIGNGKT